ncbi:MAG: hypothetical protein QM710_00225 [Flavobacterium sp.]
MCDVKVLNRTSNGILVFCPKKAMYQLLFNNLTFGLSQVELDTFFEYVKKIDCNYWEHEYRNSIYEKKIPIPTLQKNFIILFDRTEIYELKMLLNFKDKDEELKYEDIKYPLNLN